MLWNQITLDREEEHTFWVEKRWQSHSEGVSRQAVSIISTPPLEPCPMKLSFLGQSYEASVTPVSATEMAEKATFLGQQYTRKQVTAAMRQPTEALMYRGVPYSR
jgi:hypothetical protein